VTGAHGFDAEVEIDSFRAGREDDARGSGHSARTGIVGWGESARCPTGLQRNRDRRWTGLPANRGRPRRRDGGFVRQLAVHRALQGDLVAQRRTKGRDHGDHVFTRIDAEQTIGPSIVGHRTRDVRETPHPADQ
jgi:hypothetical protein